MLEYCKENGLNGMERIASPPSLRTINTIGTALYGRRDYDEATNSHLATLYFVIAFIPILPLANYRVVDASPGWRFLGKVRLHSGAKLHLWGVVAGLSLWVLVSVLMSRSSVTDGFFYFFSRNARARYACRDPQYARSILACSPVDCLQRHGHQCRA